MLRKDKLDEIACLRWSSFARLGQRMTGRSHGNELDAFNDQLQESATRLVNVIHLELQKRVYLENFPERKIVVRTSLAANNPR